MEREKQRSEKLQKVLKVVAASLIAAGIMSAGSKEEAADTHRPTPTPSIEVEQFTWDDSNKE